MGKMIVIEGLDGSGKSTQISLLKEYLESKGCAYRQIKLPDYEDPSSTLVRMYLGGAFGKNPRMLALLRLLHFLLLTGLQASSSTGR